jgi:prepilin signal peptidase PulO-like enzyme (type II secretory pathway)
MVPILFSIILGIMTGIAINYLADVLPVTRAFSQPLCIDCQEPVSWQDYILFRKCKQCGQRPALRRTLILAFCVIALVYLAIYPPTRLGYWIGWLLGSYLTLVAIIDLEHRLVLHPVSLVGAVLCLGVGYSLHGIWPTLLGGAAGFGIMLALYYLGDLFARWMAKARGQDLDEVALGFGDVILSGVLGLLLGWPGIVAGLVLAILLGGLISIALIVSRLVKHSYQPFTAIPYAPFLILGAVYLLYRL